MFALGDKEDSSRPAMLLFFDALKIAVYTENFGSHRFMDKEQVGFIKKWEVEKFGSKVILDK